MSFFDEKDVVRKPVAPVKKKSSFFDQKDIVAPVAAAKKSSFFDEQDIVSTTPPVDPEYKQVREVADRPFFDANIIGTEVTTDKELEAIARQHGVDPNELKDVASYFGARRENEEVGKSLASSFGRGVALNLPQFIAKKSEENPNFRKAIDDVQSLADARRSHLQGLAETLAPGPALIGKAEKIGKTATKITADLAKRGAIRGAGMGTIAGTANSREGSELEGAGMGLALGTAAGAGAGYVDGKFFGKPASRAEQELLEAPTVRQLDLAEVSEQASKRNAKSEEMLERAVLGGQDPQATEVGLLIRQQLPEEDAIRLLTPDTQESRLLRKNYLVPDDDGNLERKLADQIVSQRARSFAEELTGARPKTFQEAREAIEEAANRQGRQYVSERYKQFVDVENTNKAVEEFGIRASTPESGLGWVANKISGPQFVLRLVDDKFGTKLERTLSDMNRAHNKFTYIRGAFRGLLDDFNKSAVESGTDSAIRNSDAIYKAIDTGTVKSLPPELQKVAEGFTSYMDMVRRYANQGVGVAEGGRIQKMAIPEAKNYVTHTTVPMPDIISRVERSLQDAQKVVPNGKNLAQLSGPEYKAFLATPEGQKLEQFAKWKNPDVKIKNGGQLEATVKDAIYSEQGNIALERVASASQARTGGEIPDFIREKNLYKIMDKYSYDVLSALYKRQGMDQLRVAAKKLRAVGADSEANYVENIIQDTLGTRARTAASLYSKLKTEMSRKFDKLIAEADTPQKKLAYETAKATAELPQFMARFLYDNVLGMFAIRPVVQNLLSGFLTTAPEMGTKYGLATYVRGLVHAARNLPTLSAEMRNKGLIPDEFIRKGETAIADGIRASKIVSMPMEGYNKLAKMGMAFYQAAETLNRASIMGTGKMMAADLARGSKMAQDALKKFPYQLQKEVLANRNRPDLVADMIAKHLNDTTAFNYNRQSMFELGRDLGPIFATFAKWPTEKMGEALYELRSKGLVKGLSRNTERLVLPFIAIAGIDFLINDTLGLSDSDIYKKVVGSRGMSASAPLNSIISVAKGDIFTPPAIDAAYKVISPIFSGNTPQVLKGLDSLMYNYTPGSGFVRFLTDDMVTYYTGERPEGSTFTERTAEGIRRITK